MGVQLNIKDPETVRLARDLAGRTGRSVTETIRTALEKERAEHEAQVDARMAELQQIIRSVRAKLTPEMRKITSKEAQDSLYNDGVPE